MYQLQNTTSGIPFGRWWYALYFQLRSLRQYAIIIVLMKIKVSSDDNAVLACNTPLLYHGAAILVLN